MIDAIVRLPEGGLALKEVKTASCDFSPAADYWTERLHLDPHLSIHVLAARELGHPVETVLYEVTCRPALRPSSSSRTSTARWRAGRTRATPCASSLRRSRRCRRAPTVA